MQTARKESPMPIRPAVSTAVPVPSAPTAGALPVMTIYAAQKEHATIVYAQCGTTKAIKVADFRRAAHGAESQMPLWLSVCGPHRGAPVLSQARPPGRGVYLGEGLGADVGRGYLPRRDRLSDRAPAYPPG